MAKSCCLKLFHLVPLSAYLQSSALNMTLLSFLIRTHKLIRAFNEKKLARHFTYPVPWSGWVLSTCEYSWMEKNIPSGATYFGFSRMHHGNRQECWPWCIMGPLKYPGIHPGVLSPDSSCHKDLGLLFQMSTLPFSLTFSVGIPRNSTFHFAPAKLDAYGKQKTFWPTILKCTRCIW